MPTTADLDQLLGDLPGASAPADVKGLVSQAAAKYGVDPNLAQSVAQRESSSRANGPDSAKGARGPMQLMPATADDLGVDRSDTAQNIDGGVRYLKQLLDRYHGDTAKALAAYNAGMGTVDSGKPLPQETQAYVQALVPGGNTELDRLLGDLPRTAKPAQPTAPTANDLDKLLGDLPRTAAAPAAPNPSSIGTVPNQLGNLPPLPKDLEYGAPHWKPGDELRVDAPGDRATGSYTWETDADNAAAAEYNRKLDQAKSFMGPVAPPPVPGMEKLGGLPPDNAATPLAAGLGRNVAPAAPVQSKPSPMGPPALPTPAAPSDAAGIDKMKAAATAAFQPIQQQQNDLQKQATALSQMQAKAQAALAPVQQAQNDLAKQATALDQERGKLDLKSQAAVDAYNAHVQTYEAARVAANSAADSYNKQFHQPLQAANDAYNGTLATARTAFANYQQTFEQPLNAAVDAYNKALPQGAQPVYGMGYAGGTPPGPKAAPLAQGLDKNATMMARSRTGQLYPQPVEDTGVVGKAQALAKGVLESNPVASGIRQAVRGGTAVLQETGPQIGYSQMRAMGQLPPGPPPIDTKKLMGGASDVIEGTFKAASPLILAGAMQAPGATAATLGAMWGAQKGAEAGAAALGASPEAARLSGNLVAFMAGAGGLRYVVGKAADAQHAFDQGLLNSQQTAARGANAAAVRDVYVGDRYQVRIPAAGVKFAGKNFTVEPNPDGAGMRVLDPDGKPVTDSSRGSVQEWLVRAGAQAVPQGSAIDHIQTQLDPIYEEISRTAQERSEAMSARDQAARGGKPDLAAEAALQDANNRLIDLQQKRAAFEQSLKTLRAGGQLPAAAPREAPPAAAQAQAETLFNAKRAPGETDAAWASRLSDLAERTADSLHPPPQVPPTPNSTWPGYQKMANPEPPPENLTPEQAAQRKGDIAAATAEYQRRAQAQRDLTDQQRLSDMRQWRAQAPTPEDQAFWDREIGKVQTRRAWQASMDETEASIRAAVAKLRVQQARGQALGEATSGLRNAVQRLRGLFEGPQEPGSNQKAIEEFNRRQAGELPPREPAQRAWRKQIGEERAAEAGGAPAAQAAPTPTERAAEAGGHPAVQPAPTGDERAAEAGGAPAQILDARLGDLPANGKPTETAPGVPPITTGTAPGIIAPAPTVKAPGSTNPEEAAGIIRPEVLPPITTPAGSPAEPPRTPQTIYQEQLAKLRARNPGVDDQALSEHMSTREVGDILPRPGDQKLIADALGKSLDETAQMPWHEVLATPPTPPVSNDTGEKHEYSSTQFTLPPEHEVTKNLQSLAASIPPAQLAEKGIEPESHITLKYGNPGTDTAPIAAALKGKGPVTVTLGPLHVFPGKDGEPDALVADIVESPKLHAMNKAVGEAVEHTGSTFPTYHPHVTIAYLKPGQGAQYEGLKVPGITGEQITLGNVTFLGQKRANKLTFR